MKPNLPWVHQRAVHVAAENKPNVCHINEQRPEDHPDIVSLIKVVCKLVF